MSQQNDRIQLFELPIEANLSLSAGGPERQHLYLPFSGLGEGS